MKDVPARQILQVPFVDLKAQVKPLRSQIDRAIANVIDNTAFIMNDDVRRFEQEFAAYCESSFAVGTSSGTSALEMAIRAFDIGPGDEVITVANSFIATALAVTYAGATPVLVDADPQSYTIDVSQVEQAITDQTRAIIPVHLYGQPADMAPILSLAEKHNLVVIEDACQAHGAEYKGSRAGSLGHAAAFSFYPAKNLGAFGDGGIIVTNDEVIAKKLRALVNVGQTEKYHHQYLGYNHRLDSLQAAVLRIKLPHLDRWNQARQQHAERYADGLRDIEVIAVPTPMDYASHIWHLYVIRVPNNRGLFQEELRERGVHTGIHYPIPIHQQEAYQSLEYAVGDFPVSEKYANQIVSLPMFAEMTDEMIDYVCETVRDVTAQIYG